MKVNREEQGFVRWFSSSRNLDICSLAVCSCVLTVLCHQTTVVSSSPMLTKTTTSATPIASLSQVDFTIKAGLFAQSSQTENSQESDE